MLLLGEESEEAVEKLRKSEAGQGLILKFAISSGLALPHLRFIVSSESLTHSKWCIVDLKGFAWPGQRHRWGTTREGQTESKSCNTFQKKESERIQRTQYCKHLFAISHQSVTKTSFTTSQVNKFLQNKCEWYNWHKTKVLRIESRPEAKHCVNLKCMAMTNHLGNLGTLSCINFKVTVDNG